MAERGWWLPVLTLCLSSVPATGTKDRNCTARRLLPVDEARQAPGFARFRTRLLAAVQRKDLTWLKGILDRNIKYSFGADGGAAGFLRFWKLNSNPTASPFWKTLRDALRLGGTWSGKNGRFTCPYVHTRFPAACDPFRYAAITGKNVNVRAKPKLNAPVITRLSWAIVGYRQQPPSALPSSSLGGERYPWREITTPRGRRGYVWGKYVYSPIGYRAAFQKKAGRWKLVLLISGD